eukprot:3156959-Heterocapsa_arctica.AAC.1
MSQPTDINIDKIEIPSPCGPRISTYFSMALYAHIEECEVGLMDTEFEFGLLCNEKHEHQTVKGSDKFGPRSIVTEDRAWRSLG